MNLIMFVSVGILAGWLAGRVMKGGGFGVIGELVVGAVGAFLGGSLLGVLRISVGHGFVGSLVLLYGIRRFKKA